MQTEPRAKVSQLLEEIGKFKRQGKREQAYQSSLQATNAAPDEPLTWFLRSQSAPSAEERLMCLSRAYSLDPSFQDVKTELRSAVQNLLKQEPFLAYVHETKEFYQVRSGMDLLLNIPKNRAFETPYLKRTDGITEPAYRWLTLSLFALLLGGVGAVLLAPVAVFQSLRLLVSARAHSDRVRLWVVFALAVTVWLASIPISWLFLIRLFP